MRLRGVGINLTIDDEDRDCAITGTAVPKFNGGRNEPSFGPSVDDYAVRIDEPSAPDHGRDVTGLLTEAQLERVVEAVLEEANARDEDAREAWLSCSGDD